MLRLAVDTPDHFEEAIAQAAELLERGDVVAVPTETVYGLAANALDARAVSQIFRIKGRPAINPLIVHVNSVAMARSFAARWPEIAERLATHFWPGPLTLVVPKSPAVPDLVTAGGATVGLRWSKHAVMQALIERCGFPLAAPSANLSGQTSPTEAGHVLASLGTKIPLVIDGGACAVGIESTVVDVTTESPIILRPGMIDAAELARVLDLPIHQQTATSGLLRSPGMLLKHYSPRACLRVWDWSDRQELLEKIAAAGFQPEDSHVLALARFDVTVPLARVFVMPQDPSGYARALYRELHRCDHEQARLIILEAPPRTEGWAAIWDRLDRAAAGP